MQAEARLRYLRNETGYTYHFRFTRTYVSAKVVRAPTTTFSNLSYGLYRHYSYIGALRNTYQNFRKRVCLQRRRRDSNADCPENTARYQPFALSMLSTVSLLKKWMWIDCPRCTVNFFFNFQCVWSNCRYGS